MSARPICERAAAEALANVGVVEVPENRGKAVETYQKACEPPLSPGDPWCAAFVVYRMRDAAHDLSLSIPDHWPRSGYCPDHKDWAKVHGRWVPIGMARDGEWKPRPGDLALFYFAHLARVGHIEIVVEAHDWGVWTVGGNTSPEGPGVVREGDGVFRKRRDWSELGAGGGFVKLDW